MNKKFISVICVLAVICLATAGFAFLNDAEVTSIFKASNTVDDFVNDDGNQALQVSDDSHISEEVQSLSVIDEEKSTSSIFVKTNNSIISNNSMIKVVEHSFDSFVNYYGSSVAGCAGSISSAGLISNSNSFNFVENNQFNYNNFNRVDKSKDILLYENSKELNDRYMQCTVCGKFTPIGNVTKPLPDYALCILKGVNTDIKFPIKSSLLYTYDDITNIMLTPNYKGIDDIGLHGFDLVYYKLSKAGYSSSEISNFACHSGEFSEGLVSFIINNDNFTKNDLSIYEHNFLDKNSEYLVDKYLYCGICGKYTPVGNVTEPLPDYALCVMEGRSLKYPFKNCSLISYDKIHDDLENGNFHGCSDDVAAHGYILLLARLLKVGYSIDEVKDLTSNGHFKNEVIKFILNNDNITKEDLVAYENNPSENSDVVSNDSNLLADDLISNESNVIVNESFSSDEPLILYGNSSQ